MGQGYDEISRTNPNSLLPQQVSNEYDDSLIINASCGKNINCVTMKSGTLLSWGKGDHEKPKFDDFKEYSVPYPMIEDK